MMNASKIAVVVDPYSSGAYYALEFEKHKIPCIAIQSNSLPAHFVREFDPSHFIKVLSPGDNYLSHLSVWNVVAVVAGCDTGVVLTDALSKRLHVSGNDPTTSFTRRDKHLMHEALERNRLRHISTTMFSNFEDFCKNSSKFDAASYVVKPVNSAGSEGVRFVKGGQGLATAMKASAWNQRNVLGEINRGFVVQPFIQGPEFVVDMVATKGGLFVASVCRCFKVERNGSRFVCDFVDLLDPHDPEFGDLIEYAREAARALGIELGPIHMELIWGCDGPVMIEAGARLPGAGLPTLYSRVYNPDLLTAVVCTYLGKLITGSRSERQCFGRVVCLISEAEHEFSGLTHDDLKKLQRLESYWSHKLYIQERDILVRTIDFATCPGVVFLANKSVHGLNEDEREVRGIFSRYLKID